MRKHTFKCTCGHIWIIEATFQEGPPENETVVCPSCEEIGQAVKTFEKPNIIFAAMGFASTADLDLQRAKGEYIVDRK